MSKSASERCSGWDRAEIPRRSSSCMTSFFGERRGCAAIALLATVVLPGGLAAQTIAQRVAQRAARDAGPVEVIYPTRPNACGDGRENVGNVLTANANWQPGGWSHECVHGPARVVVTVIDGEVTRLRTYVGPVPRGDVEPINASAADAAAWLSSLVEAENSRVASSAILPLILADAPEPWPLLLRVARDDSRSMN